MSFLDRPVQNCKHDTCFSHLLPLLLFSAFNIKIFTIIHIRFDDSIGIVSSNLQTLFSVVNTLGLIHVIILAYVLIVNEGHALFMLKSIAYPEFQNG